jgi:hypothetical protein
MRRERGGITCVRRSLRQAERAFNICIVFLLLGLAQLPPRKSIRATGQGGVWPIPVQRSIWTYRLPHFGREEERASHHWSVWHRRVVKEGATRTTKERETRHLPTSKPLLLTNVDNTEHLLGTGKIYLNHEYMYSESLPSPRLSVLFIFRVLGVNHTSKF